MNITDEIISLDMTEKEMIDFNIKSISIIAEKTMKPRIIFKFYDKTETYDDDKIKSILYKIKNNRRINKINNVI